MSPTIYRVCNHLRSQLQHFRRAQDGLACLEFALAAPIMLALFLGGIEVTRYVIVTQKAEKAAMTISDLVAQSDNVSANDLDVLILAVEEVMEPFSFDNDGYVIISSVSRVGSGAATVNWQYTGGGTWNQSSQVGATGNDATLPNGFALDPNEGIIIAEVYYNFSPIILNNTILPNNATIYKQGVYKPRLGELTSLGS